MSSAEDRMFYGRALLLVCSLLFLCGATEPPAPTTRPAGITIAGIDGKPYERLNVTGRKAAVMIFILQDCPICNGYAPLVQRLAKKYEPEGVPFYVVHVDPTLSLADAKKHASDYGYTLPVLIDRKHELVSALHVATAPTAIVLGPDGATRYKGRLDDQYAAVGKPRTVATTHELQDAIEAVLHDEPVAVPSAPTIGCAVPDLPNKSDKP